MLIDPLAAPMMPDDLIAYLDGECDADQANVVEQALEQDEALRIRFAALVRQRVLLAEVCADAETGHAARAGARPITARRLRVAAHPPSRRRPLLWLAAAASVLLAVGILLLPTGSGPEVAPLAHVVTVGEGVRRVHDGRSEAVHVGAPLRAGDRVEVPALTFAELRFADGSVVRVAGDSTVVMPARAAGRLRLQRGELTAEVTPQPAGTVFAIATDHAVATVLGTRFTLAVTRSTTRLTVAHGRVHLSADADPSGLVVAAGDSAQVGSSGRVALMKPDAGPAPAVTPEAASTALGVPVLPADPWAGASVGTDAGLGVPRERIDVSGQSFTQALRITTPSDLVSDPRHTGEYALRLRIPTIAPLAQGDAVLATVWVRSGDTLPARTRLVVQDDAPVPQRSLAAAISAGPDWRKVELPFHAISAADAGALEVQLWLGHPGQTIEVAGLALINHGPRPLRLLAPAATYPGREGDAPWRSTAHAGIAAHRLTSLAIRVEDAQGRPIPGAMVNVRATAPRLRFGTAAVAERLLGSKPDDVRYRDELLRQFTIAVPENALKWAEREREPMLSEQAVAWLTAHHLPVRGHTLVWPRREHLPADLRAHAADPLVIRERLDRHLRTTLATFRGRFTAWDVVNDPYSADLLLEGDGSAAISAWFAIARELDPATPRFLNLYGVLDDGGADHRRQDYYERLITTLLAAGTPIDGLGLQCHQDRNLTPPDRLQAILRRFARFGLPIHITEFEVDVDDEALQADYTRDALTVFASEPAVQTVLAWGFWAGDHHRPQAAMQRADWSLKANGQVWNDLVLGAWSGTAAAITGAEGTSVLTSVRGELAIDVRHGGVSATTTITTAAAQAQVTVRLR